MCVKEEGKHPDRKYSSQRTMCMKLNCRTSLPAYLLSTQSLTSTTAIVGVNTQ